MLQTDFTWSYLQQPQPQPPQQQPQQPGLMAPAPHWAAPAPGAFGAGGFKTSALCAHTDLAPLTDPTFHDEMTGLFDCDNLLFSEIPSDEWHNDAAQVVGAGGVVALNSSDPGVSGSCANILDLGTTGTGLPGLGIAGGIPAPRAAATTGTALQSVAGIAATALGIVAAADMKSGAVVEPKLTAEASGSGSGEASADGFTLPVLGEHISSLGNTLHQHALGNGILPGEEGSGNSDEEEDEEEEEEEEEGPLGGRSKYVQHARSVAAAAAGVLSQQQQQQQQQQPTPLSSSGRSGGRSQPSTSRGQVSAASPLGKRGAAAAAGGVRGELDGHHAKRGARRRVMTRRAADANAFDDSSDEDDELRYRSLRRGGQAGLGGAPGVGALPPRSSTRLQGRPAPYRVDSDYVIYDDIEEPSSPAHGSGVSARRGRGRIATGTTLNTANGSGSGPRRGVLSRAGRRTVPLAAQRIRATSARHELKGRPSFAEIVEAGFMRPGPHRFNVGNVEVAAAVGDDGAIMYAGTRYRAISKFALVVLRERNPTRQSCDGWKEVAWNGEKLDALRVRVQAHVRHIARQRSQ